MRDFAFSIGDRVRLAANGKEGTVKAVFADAGGAQYQVEYADDIGKLNYCYFRGEDISAA